jgi:hypothetical protein
VKQIELAAAPSDNLVESYRRAVLAHAKATAAGRHRVANRNYDEIAAIANELRARGSTGARLLESLLRDDDVAVRVWAATHCLPFAAASAEAVLTEAAAGPPGPERLAAEMALSEWRAGRL